MKLLIEYFELQKKIFDYFGYVQDSVRIPLSNETEYEWYLEGEGRGDSVLFWDDESRATNDWYSFSIYTQRFLPKWVYRTEDFTMICSDTETDGNKLLAVFDNSKEVKERPEWAD